MSLTGPMKKDSGEKAEDEDLRRAWQLPGNEGDEIESSVFY